MTDAIPAGAAEKREAGKSASQLSTWLAAGAPTLVVIAVILGVMEVASWYTPSYVMPSVSSIGGALWRLMTLDLHHVLTTLLRLAIALTFAIAVGTALGCIMGMFRPIQPYLRSLVIIDAGIPALSWMLIAVFWFRDPEIRIFFILSVIIIPFYALNVHDAIRALPKDWVEAIGTFRPSLFQIFYLLILPHIVPYILMTTRSIIGYAMRMVIFAELIGAAIGIGSAMGLAQGAFEMNVVLAWTVLLVILNLVFQQAIGLIEARVLRYRPEATIR
ncbi:MAG TPA: ABC transporter permease subunit [Xanthobacteraceae bacterium]|nr:ABC transporter permease subunit [Xanthobacteraceae bacterium]